MHNSMDIEVYTLHWMFFCDRISQKPFETCNQYPHPITNINDENEKMTSGYTARLLPINIILA